MKWLVLNVRTVNITVRIPTTSSFLIPIDSIQHKRELNDEREKSMPQMEFYSCNDMAFACHTTISYGCRRRQ